MLKAGLKKEFLSFARPFRMWGMLIAIVAFAILDPILIKFILSFSTEMLETADVSGEISGLLGDVSGAMGSEMGVLSAIGDITNTGMLILMLVMMPAAGGELKKRATIIPNCSGLTPSMYLIPKFIFYPLFIFITTYIGILISYLVSFIIYGTGINFGYLMLFGLGYGFYMIFVTCLYMTLGLTTGKAGIAVAIVYGAITILTMIFTQVGIDKFNPFALTIAAQDALYGEIDYANIFGSIGITIILIAILFFLTLMVLTAKRVDNTGKEEAVL